MGKLIDSSVFIAAERGKVPLEDILDTWPDETVVMAAITASELLQGVQRAGRRVQRTLRDAYVEQLLDVIPVIPFDLVVARVHADLWATMSSAGQRISAHDLLIGATALSLSYEVVTDNIRDFSRIPDLAVVKW